MILGNTSALLLLLLLPLILLLHILLRRMESHKISSLLIWEKVKRKRKYTFPTILLLLLQMLLIVFIVLSLTDIKIPLTIPIRREASVLIIDNSASMNVIENGQIRLEDAKKKAINVIKSSLGEIMIITSSYPPQIITSYSNNRNDLIQSVYSIEKTEMRNAIEEVMKIASASVTPSGSIILISDGAFDYIPSEADNFKFIRAGKELDNNMGITDYYLRKKSNGDAYELYCAIENFSSHRSNFRFNIYKGDELIDNTSGTLESGEIKRFIFDIQSDPGQEIRGELISDDLLKTDNRASSYISSNKRKRILLVTPGNFFLEKALESIEDVLIEKYTAIVEVRNTVETETKPYLYSSKGIEVQKIPDNFDIVIYDRIPPEQQNDFGRFIYIDVIPSGIRSIQGKIRPQAVSINKNHPLLDSVDFSKVSILKARAPLDFPGIEELVSGGNTGLFYSLERKFLKFVYLPFDLTDSDLPLRASFPILINNSIKWLTDGYSLEEIIQYRTGDSILIGRANPVFKESYITDPFGKKTTIEGNFYKRTQNTGLYRLEYADQFYYNAVNLNSRDESDISSRFPEVTEEDREEKTGEYKFPLITVFLILSLLFLISEWMAQEDKW